MPEIVVSIPLLPKTRIPVLNPAVSMFICWPTSKYLMVPHRAYLKVSIVGTYVPPLAIVYGLLLMVIVVPDIPVTLVFAGMYVPVTDWPTEIPVLLETTMVAELAATVPVFVDNVVIVAAWLKVKVVASTIALIVVLAGMPRPETACPAVKLK